jgi:hypothetical protein
MTKMHFPQEMGRKCFEKHLGTTIELNFKILNPKCQLKVEIFKLKNNAWGKENDLF